MSRYKPLGDSEHELNDMARRMRRAENDRLLTFTKPPRERRKSQSQQVAEIRAMAKNVGQAEGDQHRLPFGGRKLKPEAIEQTEDDLHFGVVGDVRRWAPDAHTIHSPNLRGVSPKMRYAIIAINKKLGYEVGQFDLIVIRGALRLAIEFKSPKGGWLSDDQELWQAKWERNGGFALVSNDRYEIIEFLKRHGIGRRG